jgi:uncharacterized membrane protein YagU involved in acid resistance
MNLPEISSLVLHSMVAGVVGTAGMTGVMHLIDRAGLANAKMEVAIGSLITKSPDNARQVGLMMHFSAGIGFAVLYTILFSALNIQALGLSFGLGIITGFVHGFVMSFLLVYAVAERHPLPEFREAGFGVAVAHVVGHVVYGALVGLVLGVFALLK